MNAKGGPAKSSRFEVIIPVPKYINSFISSSIIEKILNLPNSIYNDVSDAINRALSDSLGIGTGDNPSISRYLALQCESASLPGKNLLTHDAKVYGPSFKVPYHVSYEPIGLTFLCTNEFQERKLFDRWLEAIMPTDTNNLRYAKGNDTRYMTNIKVIQYDDFIRQIYAVELIDAFPIAISPQGLSWQDGGFHRMQVQFAYQKYKTIYSGSYDIGNAVSALAGSVAARVLPFR
jgi:hypothetical protein